MRPDRGHRAPIGRLPDALAARTISAGRAAPGSGEDNIVSDQAFARRSSADGTEADRTEVESAAAGAALLARLGLPLTGGDTYWSQVPLQVEFLPFR